MKFSAFQEKFVSKSKTGVNTKTYTKTNYYYSDTCKIYHIHNMNIN